MKQHFRKKAAALAYDPVKDTAPSVKARGAGLRAEDIIQRANESGVPVYRDPSMAEVLSQLELNQEIPGELYDAAAEIFLYIYRLDQEEKVRRLTDKNPNS
ncbi:EscU/YscU/HrcU family type III secretion system export apparatus switch protein [Alkalicoccus luteus]|uniref:Type III secretion system protein n=1 Tax=Alkalicoccus luteus TaxID=1237094 RepID=A0A969TVH6_9BACI|nr:EscU/YscU/HrcU family type III secretion system export apparatus switch protein [Alkalicoccus luteus]NJP36369.1 type III secretion system protein [Alkalicoccus luteus]